MDPVGTRTFSLDPGPELFVPDPDPAEIKEAVNIFFLKPNHVRPVNFELYRSTLRLKCEIENGRYR